tara:strand:- start:329 stop:1135 length:807 start_codon:yes stop_codon:yes gene_type:complete
MILGAAFAATLFLAGNASAVITYDQQVTPANGVPGQMIFGDGNGNGSFTIDQNNGIELGLRGKLRHNALGQPENTFNSNGDGTYSFQNIVGPGQSSPTAEWSFEWAINTDFDGSSGFNLNQLDYVLGIDYNPGVGETHLTFDPINGNNPNTGTVFWDHSIGDNTTGGGLGVEATSAGQYGTLIADNNVAQQSWKPHWFIGALGFDPTVNGTYNIFLTAYEKGTTNVLAHSEIDIIVGSGAPVPEPATMTLLGLGLAGLGLRSRKRKKA